MDWNAIGAVGEILGAIAVCLSLLYLAAQTRQSNRLGLGASERELHGAYQAINEFRVSNAVVWRKGLNDFYALSDEDKTLCSVLFANEVNNLDLLIKLRKKGLVTDQDLDTWGRWCASLILCPGCADWWETIGRPMLLDESRHYLDDILNDEENRPAPAIETVSWWSDDNRQQDDA